MLIPTGCGKITDRDRLAWREQFPVTQNLIWLNHAGVSPLSRPAAEAMKNLADDVLNWGSRHYGDWLQAYEGVRVAAAKLINASPREIAIVKNTSEGIATVQMGIDWRPGDRVVAFEEEFPANLYPWKLLEGKGIHVTWLSIYDSLETIEKACRGARLLAISHVNYLSGHRVDLEAIGAICSKNNTFFLVDAIQGLGAFPIDAEACRIDALSADGHKWITGPEGCGILYVRRSRLDEIFPAEFGWTNVAGYQDYASRDTKLRADAGRYECGTLNTIGIYGLKAAMEFIFEIGVCSVFSQVISLSERLAMGAKNRGYELIREWQKETASGIISMRKEGLDSRKIVQTLKDHRICAADRQGWVRMSPHFYQTIDEMDEVLSRLP